MIEIKVDRKTLPKDGQKIKFLSNELDWYKGKFIEGDDYFYVNKTIWFSKWNVIKWEKIKKKIKNKKERHKGK